MEFEDVLKEIGGFGFYQKMLIIGFMIPTFTILPWFRLGLLFMSDTPEHWCYVSEIVHSNLSLDLQKQLVRPRHDESCSMYDINYTKLLDSRNLTVNHSWPTKECDNGWFYDTTQYDETAVTRWNLVCKDTHYNSLLLSMIFVGCVFGPPVFGFMSDNLGRRLTFCCLVVVVALTEIGSVLSPYFALFLGLRAFLASVTNAIYSCGYVILLELVSPDVRSWINGLATTSWTIGLCLLPLVAWMTRSWIRLSIVIASCAAGLACYWKILPESPRWLLSKDRYEEAHDILVKISKRNGMNAHKDNKKFMQNIKLIGEQLKYKKVCEEKHSPLEFFKHPDLRRRFFLLTMCWMGISNVYYGLQINVRNLSGNEFLNFFLVSAVEIPSHLVTWMLLERIGRRWTMVLGFSISCLSCLIPVVTHPGFPMIDVIASLLAKAGMSCSFMTLYQHAPEIFPTSLRCQGMAMSHSIAAASTLLMPYIVNLTGSKDSLQFLIFSIISFIVGIFASFLPETLKNNLPQTIEDVERFDKDFTWCNGCRSDEKESSSEVQTDQDTGLVKA